MLIGGLIGGRGRCLHRFYLCRGNKLRSYWFSDKIVLKLFTLKSVSESSAPEFYSMVRAIWRSKPLCRCAFVYHSGGKTECLCQPGVMKNMRWVAVTQGIMRI
jgi:hypothetical protein